MTMREKLDLLQQRRDEAEQGGGAKRLKAQHDDEQYLQVGEHDRAMRAFEDRLHRRQVLAPLLDKLAEDDRVVIGLYYLHGLSQAEIARRLDVSQVQVSRRLARILARLRALASTLE